VSLHGTTWVGSCRLKRTNKLPLRSTTGVNVNRLLGDIAIAMKHKFIELTMLILMYWLETATI
jgi:hypothetical protein